MLVDWNRIESWGSAFALLFWGIHKMFKLIKFHCKQEKLNMFEFEGATSALWDPLPFVTVCHILVGTFESHEKRQSCSCWKENEWHDSIVETRLPEKKTGPLWFLLVFQNIFIFSTLEMFIIVPPNGLCLLENIFLVVPPCRQRYSKIFLIFFTP